jgi:hypothetical protein
VRAALVATLLLGCGRAHFDPIGDGGNGDTVVVGDGITITSNIAFLTSIGQPLGSIGGLAGADAFCNARAQAAGLPGTYVAWLSSSSSGNAKDRLTGSRGWTRPDGKPFADTPEAIVAGQIFYPLDVDEFGNRVPTTSVGTGTDSYGLTVTGYTCSDYTSTTDLLWLGVNDRGALWWTEGGGGTNACSAALPVYCFGIGKSAPTMPPPATARRAFVLSSGWLPGGGLASADFACQTEANAASLNGTFQALLATSTASAISRFSLAGSTWARVDGVVLADTPADFAAGRTNAPLEVTAALQYLSCEVTWLGATDPSTVGSDATTCTSWTATTAGVTGNVGDCSWLGANGFDIMMVTPCDQGPLVYCLEL